MRNVLSISLCVVLIFSFFTPVFASQADASSAIVLSRSVNQLEGGLTVIDVVMDYSNARSADRTVERKQSFYSGDTLIATIEIQATFRYDGSTVSVVSKTVTQADTYSGWSFSQDSFTSSGGTVTLEGKLKYLLLFRSTPVSISLTCDKNGNISY